MRRYRAAALGVIGQRRRYRAAALRVIGQRRRRRAAALRVIGQRRRYRAAALGVIGQRRRRGAAALRVIGQRRRRGAAALRVIGQRRRYRAAAFGVVGQRRRYRAGALGQGIVVCSARRLAIVPGAASTRFAHLTRRLSRQTLSTRHDRYTSYLPRYPRTASFRFPGFSALAPQPRRREIISRGPGAALDRLHAISDRLTGHRGRAGLAVRRKSVGVGSSVPTSGARGLTAADIPSEVGDTGIPRDTGEVAGSVAGVLPPAQLARAQAEQTGTRRPRQTRPR